MNTFWDDAHLAWLLSFQGVPLPEAQPEWDDFFHRLPIRTRKAIRRMGVKSWPQYFEADARAWLACRNFGLGSLFGLCEQVLELGVKPPLGWKNELTIAQLRMLDKKGLTSFKRHES